MNTDLKILFVEDVQADALLAMRELKKGGINFTDIRVDTEEAFLQALANFKPDLIISDYSMPQFDGMTALLLKKEHAPQTPFILLTGSINEETAVECMKAGADDYLLKEHTSRISFAVKIVLENSRIKKEKLLADEALKESENKFSKIFHLSPDVILISRISDGVIVDVNDRIFELSGYRRTEIIGKTTLELNGWKDIADRNQHTSQVLEKGHTTSIEKTFKIKSGEIKYTTISGELIELGGVKFILTVIHDITDRKNAELEIKKISRLYQLVSQVNQLVLRAENRDEIFSKACNITVKQGKFLLAWVGVPDEKTGAVKPVAIAGDVQGYLDEIKISSKNSAIGNGPCGKAIRNKKYHFYNDIANDPDMMPWRNEAVKRGYRSAISLPIFMQGKVVAVFTIYAAEPFFFNETEIHLLEEVTGNISFALDAMKIQEMHKLAEEALQKSIKEIVDYKYALDQAAIVSITDSEGIIKYVNENFCTLYGYTSKEAIGQNHNMLINSGYHPKSFWKKFWQTIDKGKVLKAEVCNRSKDGKLHWGDTTIVPFLNKMGKPYQYLAIRSDITERRELEKVLMEQQLQQQKFITEMTIAAQEKERNELGKELHDNINQILATVKIYLDLAKAKDTIPLHLVKKSYEYVDMAMVEIRKLSHSLVAPSLGDIGLQGALEELVNNMNINNLHKVELINEISSAQLIDNKMELMVYRIIQEQMNNINKYAKAKKAVIHLSTGGKTLHLSVSDDGVGFDTSQKSMGIGLQNIKSRVEFYSGKLNIISAPGHGCSLEISIPF